MRTLTLALLLFAAPAFAAPAPLPKRAAPAPRHDHHPAWLVGKWWFAVETGLGEDCRRGWIGTSYNLTLAACGRASAEECQDGRWDYLPGGVLRIEIGESEGRVVYEARVGAAPSDGDAAGPILDARAAGLGAGREWRLRMTREE